MKISITHNGSEKTLLVQAGQTLDYKTHVLFSEAALVASYPWISDLVIDLGNTQNIRDSGLAILSMLSRQSGLGKTRIKLINCRPEIRCRLTRSTLADALMVA